MSSTTPKNPRFLFQLNFHLSHLVTVGLRLWESNDLWERGSDTKTIHQSLRRFLENSHSGDKLTYRLQRQQLHGSYNLLHCERMAQQMPQLRTQSKHGKLWHCAARPCFKILSLEFPIRHLQRRPFVPRLSTSWVGSLGSFSLVNEHSRDARPTWIANGAFTQPTWSQHSCCRDLPWLNQ